MKLSSSINQLDTYIITVTFLTEKLMNGWNLELSLQIHSS